MQSKAERFDFIAEPQPNLAKQTNAMAYMHSYIYNMCLGVLLPLLAVGHASCSKPTPSATDSSAVSTQALSTERIVHEVSQQARLYTTEYRIHKIVTYSDDPTIEGNILGVPVQMKTRIGDRKVAIPIDVTLKAYIDFADFSEKNVERHDSMLTLTLPDPHIIATATKIDNHATRQYIDGLRSHFTDAEITQLAAQGTDSVLSHTGQLGIVERAEQSAVNSLRPWLQSIGYKPENVTIRFRKKFSDGELLQMIEKR